MFCENCGNEINCAVRFCPNCGAEHKKDTPTSTMPEADNIIRRIDCAKGGLKKNDFDNHCCSISCNNRIFLYECRQQHN